MSPRPARWPLSLLLSLAGGCAGMQPLAESVAPLVSACEALDREARDWCSLAAVQAAPPLPAEALATLCPRLSQSAAQDHCWLLTVTGAQPRGGAERCAEIEDGRYRDMCTMEAARNLSGDSARLLEVLALCEAAGTMKGECLYHIPGVSRAAYASAAHPEVLDRLVERVLLTAPALANSPDFAAGVGVSAASLVPGAPDPCLRFPDPAVRQACWGRWDQERRAPGPR